MTKAFPVFPAVMAKVMVKWGSDLVLVKGLARQLLMKVKEKNKLGVD